MPATIAAALVKAQRGVKAVGKDGWNDHAKYRYASMDSLSEEARRALTDAGLALSVVGAEPIEVRGERRLSVTAILCHEDGSTWLLPGYSIPVIITVSKAGHVAPADKAEAAAMTYARGYLALCLLQIAREDENAVDQRRDEDAYRRPEKSETDIGPVVAAFDAVVYGEQKKLDAYIAKANSVQAGLSESDHARVGAAVARAQARVLEAPKSESGPVTGRGMTDSSWTMEDCRSFPELAALVGMKRPSVAERQWPAFKSAVRARAATLGCSDKADAMLGADPGGKAPSTTGDGGP